MSSQHLQLYEDPRPAFHTTTDSVTQSVMVLGVYVDDRSLAPAIYYLITGGPSRKPGEGPRMVSGNSVDMHVGKGPG